VAETARYLYAITREVEASALDGVVGIGGGTLDVVEHRGLRAVVSDVGLEDFGEDGLKRNLEDLAWLEKVAREHDAVVSAVARAGPTAPLRLATICLDDNGVRARLEEWHDQLRDVLDRVEGNLEWSVKAFARSQPVAEQPGGSESSAAASTPGAGAAYLKRKREQVLQRQQTEEQALRLADEVHSVLSRRSVASRRLPAQDPRLTGHEGTMTLNGAYLVPQRSADAFAAQIASLAEQFPEAHLQAGGPWPPYSFATLEQG
jgi:hypothetical protein